MILESRIYEKLYEIEILIGKTIRLDEGRLIVHWHNTGLFTLEKQETDTHNALTRATH